MQVCGCTRHALLRDASLHLQFIFSGGCVAERNGGAGFCCEDGGCTLTAGPGSAARGNRGAAGFLAEDGGALQVAEGCASRANAGWGYLATGKASTMRLAQGCQEAAEAPGGEDQEAPNRLGAVKEENGGKLL